MLSEPKIDSVIKNKRNRKKKNIPVTRDVTCLEPLLLLPLLPLPFQSVEWLGGWVKQSVCGCCGSHLAIEVVKVIVIAKTKNK